MTGLMLLGIALVVCACGYFIYGRWLVRLWGVDPKGCGALTPTRVRRPMCTKTATIMFRPVSLRFLRISSHPLRAQAL